MESTTVSASSSANGVTTVRLVNWPKQPIVEARTDGKNEITVTIESCRPNETLKLILVRGILNLFTFLTSREEERPVRTVFDAVVQVPPDMVTTLEISTAAATRHREPRV